MPRLAAAGAERPAAVAEQTTAAAAEATAGWAAQGEASTRQQAASTANVHSLVYLNRTCELHGDGALLEPLIELRGLHSTVQCSTDRRLAKFADVTRTKCAGQSRFYALRCRQPRAHVRPTSMQHAKVTHLQACHLAQLLRAERVELRGKTMVRGRQPQGWPRHRQHGQTGRQHRRKRHRVKYILQPARRPQAPQLCTAHPAHLHSLPHGQQASKSCSKKAAFFPLNEQESQPCRQLPQPTCTVSPRAATRQTKNKVPQPTCTISSTRFRNSGRK